MTALELVKATGAKYDPDHGDRVETLPDGTVVLYRDASHRYWHLTADGKTPLTAVSSVLGVLDKPGLLSWVRDVTIAGMNYWEVRDAAGTRGTTIHDAGEALAGGTMPDLDAFPDEDRGFVQSLARFWIDHSPVVHATEVIVASLTHGYAGRFDLLADVWPWGRALLDYKSSSRIYPVEMFCQLEGYEGAAIEAGHPPTDARLIVRLGEDGTYEIAQSCATFDDFLAVKAAFDARRRVERAHKAAMTS